MGANGDASTMVISSVLDPEGVPHVDAPVIPDLPLGVIQVRGSLSACPPFKAPTRARSSAR